MNFNRFCHPMTLHRFKPESFHPSVCLLGCVYISVGSDVCSQFLRQLFLLQLVLHNYYNEVLPSVHNLSISNHELLHTPFRLQKISERCCAVNFGVSISSRTNIKSQLIGDVSNKLRYFKVSVVIFSVSAS